MDEKHDTDFCHSWVLYRLDADDLNFHETCPPIKQNDQSQVTNTTFASISDCVLVGEHMFNEF
jgi:hypothetical protein